MNALLDAHNQAWHSAITDHCNAALWDDFEAKALSFKNCLWHVKTMNGISLLLLSHILLILCMLLEFWMRWMARHDRHLDLSLSIQKLRSRTSLQKIELEVFAITMLMLARNHGFILSDAPLTTV